MVLSSARSSLNAIVVLRIMPIYSASRLGASETSRGYWNSLKYLCWRETGLLYREILYIHVLYWASISIKRFYWWLAMDFCSEMSRKSMLCYCTCWNKHLECSSWLIAEKTGHRSIDRLRAYEHTAIIQEQAVSNILHDQTVRREKRYKR